MFEIFRRELDAAWDEGGLFQLVMHPFVIGYRSRIWILERLIEHAKAKGGAWFGYARRSRALGARARRRQFTGR